MCVCADAQPSDIERDTFEAVQRVLKNSESILQEIQCYKGAGKEIREAISAPTDECQRRAYLTVAPLVAKLKRFYEFSLELGESLALHCSAIIGASILTFYVQGEARNACLTDRYSMDY